MMPKSSTRSHESAQPWSDPVPAPLQAYCGVSPMRERLRRLLRELDLRLSARFEVRSTGRLRTVKIVRGVHCVLNGWLRKVRAKRGRLGKLYG